MSWQVLGEGLSEAIRLIVTFDPVVYSITFRSLLTTFYAIILASIMGIPIGVVLGVRDFKGKNIVKLFFNSMVGLPTVTLGLFLYIMFSRSGPLGSLRLLFTIPGIAIGEAILITPILVTFLVSAIEEKEAQLKELLWTLGSSEFDASIAILREAQNGVILAIVSSFNRAFAELGIAMMLGGNIRGFTRVLTTAIALETSKGDFGLSFALSIILLTVVITLNFIIGYMKEVSS